MTGSATARCASRASRDLVPQTSSDAARVLSNTLAELVYDVAYLTTSPILLLPPLRADLLAAVDHVVEIVEAQAELLGAETAFDEPRAAAAALRAIVESGPRADGDTRALHAATKRLLGAVGARCDFSHEDLLEIGARMAAGQRG